MSIIIATPWMLLRNYVGMVYSTFQRSTSAWYNGKHHNCCCWWLLGASCVLLLMAALRAQARAVPSVACGINMEFSARDEIKSLASLALPILFSNLAMFGMSMTILMVAGHLGPTQLTAVSYAQMIFDITIVVFVSGFIVGQATLSAQAFGAKNLVLVGRYCQMNCLCVTIACIPIGMLWWFCGDILHLAGISPETVSYAQQYAHWSMPWLLPRLIYQVLMVYFKSMQNVMPAAVFAVTFAVLNVGVCLALVNGIPSIGFEGYGLIGCPISMVIMHYTRTITFILYMFWYRKMHASSWKWEWTFVNFKVYLAPMLKVGGPMVIGELVENLQLQAMSIFAAMTSEVALGAHNSMFQLILFLSSPIFGMMDGGLARMGMYLGAGNAAAAKATSRLILYMIAGLTFFIVVVWFCARSSVGRLFSNDEEVVKTITSISTLAAAGYIILAFFYHSMAALEAMSRTVPIMSAFFVGAWVVGVPLAYVLCFPADMGLFGIWVGMSVGYIVTTMMGEYFYCRSDWDEEARKAVERSKARPELMELEILSSDSSHDVNLEKLEEAYRHLGPTQLTAVAYSQMIFDITILIFASGFIVGQATLSSQAYGAKNLVLVGRYCQMNCLCVALACIPIGVLWYFCGDILQAVGISPETVAYAKQYSHWSMPWLLP
ncbi:Multidrug/Oligosaccharidyl-lipid/Polysaccharide (MOP) Flippase Superfamily, partial [Thraustotheca clavata]